MARKKTITREQILKAAHEVVASEGFSKFTARNIATKMKCSTQPIYLEFKNMDDLKQTLIQDIFDYLSTEVFTREVTGNKLVDFGLNYIDFATSEKRLYRALYLEDSGNGELMQETSFEWFKKVSSTDPEYSTLSDEQFQSVYMGFWIMTTGLASLMSAGIINPTRDRTIEILEDTLTTIVHDNVSIVVDVNHSKEIL